MKIISKLSLLALAFTLASCNEKVAPELQSGNNSSTDPDAVPIPPEEYYFAVQNSSASTLGYRLHKTGLGNVSKNCEVRNTTGFSSDAYRGNPTAHDISCYFDAEELSLMAKGMNFKIQASKNSCDFIGYSPFGYYNKVPGDSSGTYTQIECTGDANSGHVASVLTAPTITTSGTALGCGEWASSEIATADRIKFGVENDQDLCRFNYEEGEGEQCDIGVININKYTVNYQNPADSSTTPVPTVSFSTRQVRCGGKLHNCVKGPTKEIDANVSKVTEITQTTVNSNFELEYKYEGLIGTGLDTRNYVNFRRNLASLNLDYISTADAGYKSFWSDPIFGKTFDPRVMDFYAANYMLDGVTRLISVPTSDAERIRSNTFTARPLAADPFVGIGSLVGVSNQVNPFYTFYCFDNAFDVKARIRLVVRDWDRVFPSNSDQEYLSDIFRGAAGRQDNPDDVEIPGDIDAYNGFNDVYDWDDVTKMERTPGTFDPFTTIWKPLPVMGYPNGWYNRDMFPYFESRE